MASMSGTTNLNIRIDSSLKKESEVLFKDLGLNMTTAISMFLTKCVNTESIPFKIDNKKPSRELKKALKEAEYISEHPEKYKGYNNIDELFQDLDKDE